MAEAVLTSFRLIWDAALCIVQVLDPDEAGNSEDDEFHLEAALSSCRWFTRAWALQEPVAASTVHLLDRDWNVRATKSRKAPTLAIDSSAGRTDKEDVDTMQGTREPASPLSHRPHKRARTSGAGCECPGSHTAEESDDPDCLVLMPRRGDKRRRKFFSPAHST